MPTFSEEDIYPYMTMQLGTSLRASQCPGTSGKKESQEEIWETSLESINRPDKADKSQFDRNSRCGCSTLPPLTPPSFTVSKYEHPRIRMSEETIVRSTRKIVQSLFNRMDERTNLFEPDFSPFLTIQRDIFCPDTSLRVTWQIFSFIVAS